MLHRNDFSYYLPKELIGQAKDLQRDHSRLLFLDRQTQQYTSHHFYDLPKLLQQHFGSQVLLVRNNTKVIPARLYGQKETGGKVEVLLTRDVSPSHSLTSTWQCITKPSLKIGQKVYFKDKNVLATCVSSQTDDYLRTLEFNLSPPLFLQFLQENGHTPIPPYVQQDIAESQLRQLYQTVYAHTTGSVAAPTAGLHFTHQLLQKLRRYQINTAEVTLHVSLGTFLGVKNDDISLHHMHHEHFVLDPKNAQIINEAKLSGKKVIAIGTTSVRVLESCVQENGLLKPQSGETDIFIYPSYKFNAVDGLITNFHLPQSTLLMLVSAFISAPNAKIPFTSFKSSFLGQAYQHAVAEKYKFFSFGDGMLII